jgi:hypothetical protein
MKTIAFIEDEPLVKKSLKHLHIWDVKRKPPPCANRPPAGTHSIYDQSSSPSANDYIIDVDYSIEATFKKSCTGKATSHARLKWLLNKQKNSWKIAMPGNCIGWNGQWTSYLPV